MPFAHCLDCGSSVLVDPAGRCPEGHVVGAAGARVAAGIGSAVPHPDEPVPWVRMVDPDAVAAPAAPRVARPPAVAGTDTGVVAGDDLPDADDLFRELHALGSLDDDGDAASGAVRAPAPAPAAVKAPAPAVAPAPAPAAVAPPSPTRSVAPAYTAPVTPAPPSSPEDATDLDELASLVAAVNAVDDRRAVRDLAPPTGTPAPMAPPVAVTSAPAPVTPAPAPFAAVPPVAATPIAAPPAAAPPAAAPVAAPVAAAASVAPPPAATDPSGLDNLTFTAKGTRVGRRERSLESKTAKRGMFRR